MNREMQLLRDVQKSDFALQEAALFLDGHPHDREAIDYFNYHLQMAKNARRAYEAEIGPLSFYGVNNEDAWDWVDGPWPWEGEV